MSIVLPFQMHSRILYNGCICGLFGDLGNFNLIYIIGHAILKVILYLKNQSLTCGVEQITRNPL